MSESLAVKIGSVVIGGNNPVLVQSMTNTPTREIDATASQVLDLWQAGSELIRFTVKDEDDAAAVPYICDKVRQNGCTVPLVGDFHYNGHLLLTRFPVMAKALDKYRINPGNVGKGERHDNNFRTMVQVAIDHEKPVRIGVNGGSLDQELLAKLISENNQLTQPLPVRDIFLKAMADSALSSAQAAESYGLPADKIVLSAKVSQVPDVIKVYRDLRARSNYALHVGLTEAGMGMKGTVCSSVALGILLNEGIGDTIRVSLTPAPGDGRANEVYVAQEILQSLGQRFFVPQVTSCPGCGRTGSTLFQNLALRVQEYLRERTPQWRQQGLSGFEQMKVAVMGCIVNGPGEAKDANIGISLPGSGEDPHSPVFIDGQKATILKGDDLADQFLLMIENYVNEKFAVRNSGLRVSSGKEVC